MTEEFEKLLRTDPLLEAEKITGKSYKEDEATSALGLLLHMQKGQEIKDEMILRDDTHYSSDYGDATRIVTELGFKSIFSKIYTPAGKPYVAYNIFWRDGVLLTLESYTYEGRGQHVVNSLNIYGNWLPNEGIERWNFTSSGHFTRKGPGYDDYATPEETAADPWVWVGHWDGRIGFRNLMDRLDNNGTWLSTWVGDPWLWLHSYGEGELPKTTREQDPGHYHELATTEKVQKFPPAIRDMIFKTKADEAAKREAGRRK